MLADGLYFQKVNDLLDDPPVANLLSLDRWPEKGRQSHTILTVDVASQKNIGNNADPWKELYILKRPSNAALCYFMGMKTSDVLFVKENLSLLWMIIAGNTVQQARFTRTIWPNNSQQLSGLDRKIYVIKGQKTSKTQ